MAKRFFIVLFALGVLVPGLSQAARFDLIYADGITMRAPLDGWGITLAGMDFGLIVNKGTASLGPTELSAADFTVAGVPEWPDTTTTRIDPWLRPGFNIYSSAFTPIQPNEAVGSVNEYNGILTSLVAPGETFRNTTPAQFVYFEMGGTGNSPGVVRFDVQLRMGDDSAGFPIFVTLVDSPAYSIEFTHVARVSSAAVTATRPTTWGRLKSLYR